MSSLENKVRVIAVAMLITACGTEPPAPPRGKSADASANDQGKNLGDSEFENEFGGDGEGSEFEEVDTGTTKSLDEMLAECGDIDFDKPDAIIVDNTMAGLRIVKEGNLLGLAYRVTVDPVLRIESSIVKSTTTTDFTVAADPFLAQSFAEDEVASRKGSHTTEYFPREERSEVFAKDAAWNGIVCTVQPAYRTVNQVGGQNVVTEYEPALPASISPKADAVRYADEWQGGARTWQGIKATVRESTSEAAPTGTEITGTVSIRPIEKSATVTDGDGVTHTIQADLAYEISMDFGGAATTKALGLNPLTRFYIDHMGRTFAAIQSDASDGETPVATFLNNPGLR